MLFLFYHAIIVATSRSAISRRPIKSLTVEEDYPAPTNSTLQQPVTTVRSPNQSFQKQLAHMLDLMTSRPLVDSGDFFPHEIMLKKLLKATNKQIEKLPVGMAIVYFLDSHANARKTIQTLRARFDGILYLTEEIQQEMIDTMETLANQITTDFINTYPIIKELYNTDLLEEIVKWVIFEKVNWLGFKFLSSFSKYAPPMSLAVTVPNNQLPLEQQEQWYKDTISQMVEHMVTLSNKIKDPKVQRETNERTLEYLQKILPEEGENAQNKIDLLEPLKRYLANQPYADQT